MIRLLQNIKNNKFYEYLPIGSVLFLAFALRIWGINWGMPLKKAHIDEAVVIFYSMRFLTGDMNPHIFFDYPSLFLYILGILFYIIFLFGKLFGIFPSLDSFVGIYLNGDASFLYIAARLISVLCGVGSVYLIYRIAKEHFSEPKSTNNNVGLLSALIFAILPSHVLHSHYATVDVACIFFLLLSFLYFGRYYNSEDKTKNLYIGSFILGLATAIKYYPAILFIPLFFFVYLKEKNKVMKIFFRNILFSFSLLVTGFIIGCPYSIIDISSFLSRFINRFTYIIWPSSASRLGFDILTPFKSIITGLTFPIFFVLMLGIILAIKFSNINNKKNIVFWLAFPLFYLFFLATWNIVIAHYLFPTFPFLIILGVFGLNLALQRVEKRTWIKLSLITILILSLFIKTVKIDVLLNQEDTRLKAYDWIKHNLPRGSRILRFPYTPEFSNQDPFFVRVDWEGKLMDSDPKLLVNNFDYIILSYFGNDQISQWEKSILKYFKKINEWKHISLGSFHHPRIIIYGKQS